MPKSLRCPACGRALTPPVEPGIVVCDGCNHRFDPDHLRYIPAPWPRRLLGWSLFLTSAYLLLVSATPAIRHRKTALNETGSKQSDAVVSLVVILLIPAVPFFLGWHFAKGRMVELPVGASGDAAVTLATPLPPDRQSD